MITREQALKLGYGDHVHYTGEVNRGVQGCLTILGPRGGVVVHQMNCRVTGRTQVWKTRPTEFRVPVKYGTRESGSIRAYNNANWHLASECAEHYMRTQCERCTWRSWLPGPRHYEMIMPDGKPCPNSWPGGQPPNVLAPEVCQCIEDDCPKTHVPADPIPGWEKI